MAYTPHKNCPYTWRCSGLCNLDSFPTAVSRDAVVTSLMRDSDAMMESLLLEEFSSSQVSAGAWWCCCSRSTSSISPHDGLPGTARWSTCWNNCRNWRPPSTTFETGGIGGCWCGVGCSKNIEAPTESTVSPAVVFIVCIDSYYKVCLQDNSMIVFKFFYNIFNKF